MVDSGGKISLLILLGCEYSNLTVWPCANHPPENVTAPGSHTPFSTKLISLTRQFEWGSSTTDFLSKWDIPIVAEQTAD